MEGHQHPGSFALRTRDPRLEARWDRLARDVAASPFSRPGWVAAWAGSFGHEVRVATVERDDHLVAVLPVVVTGRRARTAADWHVPHAEIVALDSEAHIAMMRGLDHHFARITMDFVVEGTLTELMASVVLESRPQRRIVRQRSPHIDTSGDVDAYLEELSTKKLREIRRRRRRMAEEIGEVRYHVVDGAGEWESALRAGIEVEASGWKGEAGTAVASDPATEAFYTRVARWAAAEKLLEVGLLTAGTRVVAFDLSLCDGYSTWLLKTGFDHELGRFAPGQILRHDAIMAAFERGLGAYEFTGESEAWKDEWTTHRRRVVMIDAFRYGSVGRMERFAARVVRAARVHTRRIAGRRS